MIGSEQIVISPEFSEACGFAKVAPSKRQASKFRNGYGALWNATGGDLGAYIKAERKALADKAEAPAAADGR